MAQTKPPRLPRPDRKPPPAGRPRGQYTPEAREHAVELYRDRGLAAAAEETGVPKGTLRGWAKAAGVDAGVVNARVNATTAAATAASVTSRAARVAAARDQLVDLQAQIAVAASELELEILGAHAAVAREGRKRSRPRRATVDEDGQVTLPTATLNEQRLAALMQGPHLTQVVGSRTRAIHDLQLLDGKATEQPEGGLVIRFALPALTQMSERVAPPIAEIGS